MKNSIDNEVREKMGSLSPLSGGIVFGKEEAWEKLQARMEAKPAARMAVWYWMAAASVLLLFVCVLTINNYPSTQVVKNNSNEIIQNPSRNSVEQSQPLIVQVQPEKTIEQKTPFITKGIHKTKTSKSAEKENLPVVSYTPSVQEQVIINETVNNIVVVSPPAKPIVKQMKVMHINDLEEQNILQKAALNSPLVVNKTQVLHVNDIAENERQVQALRHSLPRRENIAVSIPFIKSLDRAPSSVVGEEIYTPHNSFKIKLN